MGYSKEIYDKAFKFISDTKKAKEQAYLHSLDALRGLDKNFRDIEVSLSKLGSELVMVAFSGNTKRLDEIKEECEKLTAEKNKILKAARVEKPGFYCDKCQDSGYLGGSVCGCVKEVARKFAFEELSSSLPLNDCSFDSFDLNFYPDTDMADGSNPRKRATAILNLCRQFANDFPSVNRSLLFMGDAGLGKTHLSLSLVREISAKGYGVVYGSAQNLFSAAEKEHFSFSGTQTAEESLLNCDLLVIDDLGTEFYSAFTASLFYNIINSRLLSGKPTVINTNLSFNELEKKYSERIASRFIGGYDMKKFIGSDIRQIKALKNI
ncbi:MAG: ATP-binding protein [Clostridia bacterium]|nr:ATP-binding protein [Clostridia bacterium]